MLTFEDHQHIFCNLVLNHLNGDKVAEWFEPSSGLCHNFQLYLRSEGHDIKVVLPMSYTLMNSFVDYTGDLLVNVNHPFNNDIFSYFEEANNNQLYTNAKRLNYLLQYSK